jgi:hypothetical protein
MRHSALMFLPVMLAASAHGQSSMSACGPLPDSSARQVIKVSGGVRVCLLATRLTSPGDLPREWAARATNLVLETQRDGDNRRAALSGNSLAWTINGRAVPQDSLADAWQKAVVDYADAAFQADELHLRVAELRSEIDSLPSRIQATRERIEYLERRERELNLEILNAGNRRPNERGGETAASEASLRSDIQRLEAQRSAAERRASSAEAQAAAERDDRKRASYEAQAREAHQKADGLAQNIKIMEHRLNGGSAQAVAVAQEELRMLQPRQNIALLKLQLANYESIDVEDIEREIREIEKPQWLPALDAQVEKARLSLFALLDAKGR